MPRRKEGGRERERERERERDWFGVSSPYSVNAYSCYLN
jgi:hypothetical protein